MIVVNNYIQKACLLQKSYLLYALFTTKRFGKVTGGEADRPILKHQYTAPYMICHPSAMKLKHNTNLMMKMIYKTKTNQSSIEWKKITLK